MTNNFITDNEIDRILGRITEYRKEPEKRTTASTRYISVEEKARIREEYARKKAQEFAASYAAPSAAEPMYDSNTKYSSDLNKETQRPSTIGSSTTLSAFTSAGISAGMIRKTYAFLTDMCIVGLVMVAFVSVSIYLFGTGTFNNANIYGAPNVGWMLGGLYSILFVLYMVYFEGLTGQTLGKMFLNIRVMDQHNRKPSFSTMMTRTVIFLVLPLGILGLHNVLTRTRTVTNG